MRHLLRNSILAIALLLLLSAKVYPPERNLRLGKDLAGGVSLTYGVQMAPTDDAEEVLSKTIEVLKRRVDPNGQLDIAMVAQGRDRIEITMPLPSDEVAGLRDAFEEKLAGIGGETIDADEFDRIMRMDNGDAMSESPRRAYIRSISSTGSQEEQFQEAALRYDRAQVTRASLDLAIENNESQSFIDELVMQVATAELEYEEQRRIALGSAVSSDDVRRILNLSDSTVLKFDELTDEPFELASARDRAWESLLLARPDLEPDFLAARESWETYEEQRRTLDDPNDLIRLLSGAGVLNFRITCDPGTHPEEQRLRSELQERGPRNARANDAGWFRINKVENWFSTRQEYDLLRGSPSNFFLSRGYVAEEYDGEYYMLCWDRSGLRLTEAEGDWAVDTAFEGVDQIGRPAISFNMDSRGAPLLGRLTEQHVGDNMAVLLDDEIYTAPNLLGRIASNGQITGDFSDEERSYIINVLSAGSLQARLTAEPISISTIGPDLGLDNLQAGLKAGYWAIGAVSVFMVLYYFMAGGVAVITLICSAIVILGAMSLNRAAFTLPGIAGVVLTFGMAVDANVLIYERIREELRNGLELKKAVRLGFNKALSSIVDGNVTNLIVCFVLAYTGTQEIKGFAITLGIGVLATLFSALVVARIVFAILVDVIGIKSLKMLPSAIPIIDRVLEPKIDWMKLRYAFVVISLCYVGIGIGMIAFQGSKMLDNEFLGGTQVTLRFQDPATQDRVLLSRSEVQERVHAIGEGVAEEDPIRELRIADVLVIGPEPDGVTSDTFTIKTTATNSEDVLAGLLDEFQNELTTLPPLTFAGVDDADLSAAPVYSIINGNLGSDVGDSRYQNDVREWVGGLAVIVDGISPPASEESIRQRLDTLVSQPDFRELASRQRDIVILEGSRDAVTSLAVLTLDGSLNSFDDEDRFAEEVSRSEWELVREAFQRTTTPASVQTFSPAIAATFKAQAIVAVTISILGILIYIWVRFGSVRYSAAAIVTLCHDVLTAIGLIALAEIVYDFESTAAVAQKFGVMPFKIDLSLVAAILTIIGYSLNDTIIIMDRIRENRGKLDYTPRSVINKSINQTISRTVITSGTTLIATLILYVNGGEGVRAFSYALLIGIVVGTYSSIAVAAPLTWSRKQDRGAARDEAAAESAEATPA